MTKSNYPAIQSHGPLVKVSDDVYVVNGCYKMGPGVRVSQAMVIVRRDGSLSLVNTIRLDEETEASLKELGKIEAVVRICSNHGSCDAYYVESFGAKYYDLKGAAETEGATPTVKADALLEDGEAPPSIPDAKIIVAKNLKMPDAILRLPDAGGILVTGDFVQNGVPTDYESFAFRKMLAPMLGFTTGRLTTPAPTLKLYGNGEDVYVNVPVIMDLEFDTVIPAHGPMVQGGAKEKLKEGFAGNKKTDMWKSP